MISDELYKSAFKNISQRTEESHKEIIERDGPEVKLSVLSRYAAQKEAVFAQTFNKKIREEMGLPTYGSIRPLRLNGNQIATSTKLMKPTRSIVDASTIMASLIMNNVLTKDKIDSLTLEDYREMCGKIFGSDAEIPSQEALNNFKKFAKELTITDPTCLAYLLKTPPVVPYTFKNFENIAMSGVIVDTCKKISEGRDKPIELRNFATKHAKRFEAGMDMRGLFIGKSISAVLTFGISVLWEAGYNLLSKNNFKDLPKRDLLHPAAQLSPLLNNFEQSMSEFSQQETGKDTINTENKQQSEKEEQTNENYGIGKEFDTIEQDSQNINPKEETGHTVISNEEEIR